MGPAIRLTLSLIVESGSNGAGQSCRSPPELPSPAVVESVVVLRYPAPRLVSATCCGIPPGSLPVAGILLRPPQPSSEIVIPIRRPAFVSAMAASFAVVGKVSAIPPGRLSPGARCFSPREPVPDAIPLRACTRGPLFVRPRGDDRFRLGSAPDLPEAGSSRSNQTDPNNLV